MVFSSFNRKEILGISWLFYLLGDSLIRNKKQWLNGFSFLNDVAEMMKVPEETVCTYSFLWKLVSANVLIVEVELNIFSLMNSECQEYTFTSFNPTFQDIFIQDDHL